MMAGINNLKLLLFHYSQHNKIIYVIICIHIVTQASHCHDKISVNLYIISLYKLQP